MTLTLGIGSIYKNLEIRFLFIYSNNFFDYKLLNSIIFMDFLLVLLRKSIE